MRPDPLLEHVHVLLELAPHHEGAVDQERLAGSRDHPVLVLVAEHELTQLHVAPLLAAEAQAGALGALAAP
jgi:hypothetical protein